MRSKRARRCPPPIDRPPPAVTDAHRRAIAAATDTQLEGLATHCAANAGVGGTLGAALSPLIDAEIRRRASLVAEDAARFVA